MNLLEDLAPMGSKKVAVVIGRFNPPTRGHYALIDAAKQFIRKNKSLHLETAPVICIIGGSKSDQDKKKNPLSVEDRERFMKASGQADGCTFIIAPDAFAAFAKVRDAGMEPIAIAAGTDRSDSYEGILNKYFKTPDDGDIEHHTIELKRDEKATDKKQKKISVDDVLKRAHDGEDIDIGEVSGSLARRAAELDYAEEFANIVGLTDKPKLAAKMMAKIKAAMAE